MTLKEKRKEIYELIKLKIGDFDWMVQDEIKALLNDYANIANENLKTQNSGMNKTIETLKYRISKMETKKPTTVKPEKKRFKKEPEVYFNYDFLNK